MLAGVVLGGWWGGRKRKEGTPTEHAWVMKGGEVLLLLMDEREMGLVSSRDGFLSVAFLSLICCCCLLIGDQLGMVKRADGQTDRQTLGWMHGFL